MSTPKIKTAATKAPPKAKQLPKSEPALMTLFIDSIKDIYWAENQLVKSLPKMQKAAASTELSAALEEHLETTKQHVSRLDQVFAALKMKPEAKKCEAMDGLTKEGDEIVKSTEEGSATRDVGIIMAAQKIEHYEIATYGSLAQLAIALGLTEVADLLVETLDEEKEADEILSDIAENSINYDASEEE